MLMVAEEQARSQKTSLPASSGEPAVLQDTNVVLIDDGYFEKSEDGLKGLMTSSTISLNASRKSCSKIFERTNQPETCQEPPLNFRSPGHGKSEEDL